MTDKIDKPCAKCGSAPRHRNSCYCLACYREYYRDRQRAKRKNKTLCMVCGVRPRAKNRTRCPECLAADRLRDAKRRERNAARNAERAELLADAAAARAALAALKAGKL